MIAEYFYPIEHEINQTICEIGTTSEERTKLVFPKCPLFGGLTVSICAKDGISIAPTNRLFYLHLISSTHTHLVSAPAPFLLLCGGGEERVWGIGLTTCGVLAGMLVRVLECN